eukprot:5203448-Prymnesium_polylepis.1
MHVSFASTPWHSPAPATSPIRQPPRPSASICTLSRPRMNGSDQLVHNALHHPRRRLRRRLVQSCSIPTSVSRSLT